MKAIDYFLRFILAFSLVACLSTVSQYGQTRGSFNPADYPWLPRDTIKTPEERNADSSAQYQQPFIVQDSVRAKTDNLYDSIKVRAHKNKFTEELFELLVIDKDTSRNGKKEIQKTSFENYNDKIIRRITLTQVSVFGPTIFDTISRPLKFYERAGNKLHINTSARILHKNILFKPGDRVDGFLLAENGRILRQLPFIEDARIVVIPVKEDPEYVDIEVFAKDLWPLGFGLEISNLNTGNLSIWNRNIFGFGRELTNTIFWDSDKQPLLGYKGDYRINNISGTFIGSKLKYINRFNTLYYSVDLQKKFLTTETKYAGGFTFENMETHLNIELRDSILADESVIYNLYDLWAGRAFLLNGNNFLTGRRTNLMIAARYYNIDFADRPQVFQNYLYAYHNRKLLLGTIGIASQGFTKGHLIYGFGQTEDIPYGYLLQFTGGYEYNEFNNRPYAGLMLAHGNFIGIDRGYLLNNIEFGGFLRNRKIEQGVFSLKTNYFTPLYSRNRFKYRYFINAGYTTGINRFDEEFVTIENKEGIYGLNSSRLKGIQKLTLNIEATAFTPYYFNGFRFAFFGFTDIGFVGPGKRFVMNNKIYSGFGIGVRMRNERLVFNTFQIKLAFYPVTPDDADWQFIQISGEQKLNFRNFFISPPKIVDY